MNGLAVLEAALILVTFRICLLISLNSCLDNGWRLILHILWKNSNSLAFSRPDHKI